MRAPLIVVLLALAGAPAVTTAQTVVQEPNATFYPHLGVQGSVGQDVNLGLGVRYENRMLGMFPEAPNLRFATSFDYFFPDSPLSYWELNGDVFNLFAWNGARIVPYLGGGINVARQSAGPAHHTDVGVNLVGGARLPGRYRPYLEGRVELGGGNRFVLTLGWLIW